MSRSAKALVTSRCPCGSSLECAACCGRIHAGFPAPTAEALMRARYTAYVLGLTAFLEASWHPDTRPAALDLGAPPRPQWLGLNVLAHHEDDADHATVEFAARYKLNGRALRLHETSRFVRVNQRWVYVDGEIHE